jgi:dihydrofolate reductase
MSKVIYSMNVSLDGFIAGPDGDIDWSAPDQELHRFHNEQTREASVHLLGRRLYETMRYWDTAEEEPGSAEEEFAQLWRDQPKVVFSRTLENVEGNAMLATGEVADEVARLREEHGGVISVGGAGLASTLIEQDLVDEYRLFVNPVIVGGGTPYFPPLRERLDLRLAETRTFGSGVVYLRCERHPAHG